MRTMTMHALAPADLGVNVADVLHYSLHHSADIARLDGVQPITRLDTLAHHLYSQSKHF